MKLVEVVAGDELHVRGSYSQTQTTPILAGFFMHLACSLLAGWMTRSHPQEHW